MAENKTNGELSVLNMVETYAAENNTSVDDIFKKDAAPAPKKEEPKAELSAEKIKPVTKTPAKESGWQPDPELIADMEELNDDPTGAVYTAEEMAKSDPTGPRDLVSVTDDIASQAAIDQMDELQRCEFSINRAKEQLGIKHLNIPVVYNAQVMDRACSMDAEEALQTTKAILTEIIELHPESVIEWLPGFGPDSLKADKAAKEETPAPKKKTQSKKKTPAKKTPAKKTESKDDDAKNDDSSEEPDSEEEEGEPEVTDENVENEETPDPDPVKEVKIDGDPNSPQASDIRIIIDKRQASNVVFDADDKEKIRKSRTVELQIVESRELHYNVIDEPENDIDTVLAQYTRKFNDISVSLPASRYRCTLTGLSYPEILDLSYSTDLNNLDGERKKWSIVYNHIHNASIGQFADYDDFLQKTSYLDLDFLLWGILCATCQPQELISIDCHAKDCGNTYDWMYSPSALLQIDKMSPQTLEDMKVTGEAQTKDQIEKQYNESMLRLNNSVVLPGSGFVVCFGHISAYTYLNDVYGRVEEIRKVESTMYSEALGVAFLTGIKYMLLPTGNGENEYRKVTRGDDILKVINVLNEVDFKAVSDLMDMMLDPYNLSFVLKDIICPKCRTKSSITIDDMGRLLFLVAQSLANVNVALKKQ